MHMHIPREACGSAAWGKLSGAAGCIPRIPTAWDSPSRNEAPGTLSGSSALIASRCATHPWLPRHSSQRALVPRVIESGVTLLVRRPAWGTWSGKNYVSCCDTGIMTATSIRLRCSFWASRRLLEGRSSRLLSRANIFSALVPSWCPLLVGNGPAEVR